MANNSPRKRKRKSRIRGILGLALDNQDGQKRITRTEEMILLGGSRETHERMQETAIRFSEALEKTGRKLQELPVRKAIDLLREAHERTGT